MSFLSKFFIIHVIGWLATAVGAVWSIVSFILYLEKDQPFQWTSIVVLGIGLAISIVNMLRMFIKRYHRPFRM